MGNVFIPVILEFAIGYNSLITISYQLSLKGQFFHFVSNFFVFYFKFLNFFLQKDYFFIQINSFLTRLLDFFSNH